MAVELFPPGDSINNTLGSLLLGNLAAGIFFGITLVQTHLFFTRGQGDHWVIKFLVLLLLAIDTFHLVAITHAIYGYAVTNFGNLLPLMFPDWGILSMVGVGGISDAIVRGIYTFRIYRLGGSVMYVLIDTVASLFVLGNVLAFIVEAKRLKDMISIAKVSWILDMGFIAPAVADIFITATLILTLRRQRTGLEHTDSIINTLIFYSVQSGALTCILAMVTLVTHVMKPYTYISFGVYFLMPKVYLNALLATLNARKGLRSSRGRSRGRELISLAYSKFRGPTKRRRAPNNDDIRIQIETITEQVMDPPIQRLHAQGWEEKSGPLHSMMVIGGPRHVTVKRPSDGEETTSNLE